MQNHSLEIIDGNSHSLEIIDDSIPSFDTPLIFNNDVDTSNVKNLLLIDSIVSESQLFFDSSNQDTFPIIYSNNSSKEDFIKLLDDKFKNGLEKIAFVFHDNIKDGKTFLNQELFFSEDFNSYSPNTQLLIDVIKKFSVKNIDFLACNSLNYSNWVNFYEVLAKETGVIVGASNDNTGNLKHGGNWVMENTNENVVSTYFNSNINSYASTLASTITNNGGIIYILKLNDNNIYYFIESGSLTQITSWPVTIVNSNPVSGNILTVSITSDITISDSTVGTGTNGYFITGSEYITYDGTGKTITISNVTDYLGLIQNGTSSVNGYSNITLKNILFTTINSTLVFRGGWICQSFFGNSSFNTLISNCNVDAPIGPNQQCGGFCGRGFAQGNGTANSSSALIDGCSKTGLNNSNAGGGITCARTGQLGGYVKISNCSNSGAVSGQGIGGICGQQGGQELGKVEVMNCSNNGAISGIYTGGICGSLTGYINGNVSITNCSNSGAISGQYAGGITGSQAGQDNGTVSITNCINSGVISGQSGGGICGLSTGYNNGNVSITNCSNNGNISANYSGGICGGDTGFINGSVSIINCFNNSSINGNFSGGITSNFFGVNSNNLCSIINCYNTGNINGSNAGGITGAEVGYTDNAIYIPKILIQNCYSLGNIATIAGGICGGTEGRTYTNIPIVNITNCYTVYDSIADSGSEYISNNLPIKNSIILTNVYSSLNNGWSDTNASSALSGALNIYRNSRLYKYYSNFGEVWYSNQNNTPFSFTTELNTVPRRKERRN